MRHPPPVVDLLLESSVCDVMVCAQQNDFKSIIKNKLAEWDAPMSQIVSLTATSALSSLIFLSQFGGTLKSIFVKTFSSTTLRLRHGFVVMGIIDAFVYAHNNHRHNTDNPWKYEDCMEGRIRLLTAITPSYANAYSPSQDARLTVPSKDSAYRRPRPST